MKKSTKKLIEGLVLMAAYLVGYSVLETLFLVNGLNTALSVFDFSFPFDSAFGIILFLIFMKGIERRGEVALIKKALTRLLIVIAAILAFIAILHFAGAFEKLYTAIMSSDRNVFDKAAAGILAENKLMLPYDEFTLSSILYSIFIPDEGFFIRIMVILLFAQGAYIIFSVAGRMKNRQAKPEEDEDDELLRTADRSWERAKSAAVAISGIAVLVILLLIFGMIRQNKSVPVGKEPVYYNVDHSFTVFGGAGEATAVQVTFLLNRNGLQYRDILNGKYDHVLTDCVEEIVSGTEMDQLINDKKGLEQLILDSIGRELGYAAIEDVIIVSSHVQG
ncbi:MAG: hypothetical protein IJI65_06320 [Lachnospiraceae bacterium]|nr:hypothetical protein [Lachnospiraceae bacterium]